MPEYMGLHVACPTCGALPGERCILLDTSRGWRSAPHYARQADAQSAPQRDPLSDAAQDVARERIRAALAEEPTPEEEALQQAREEVVQRAFADGVAADKALLQDAHRRKTAHPHESWQIREAPDGSLYCAACGDGVPSKEHPNV